MVFLQGEPVAVFPNNPAHGGKNYRRAANFHCGQVKLQVDENFLLESRGRKRTASDQVSSWRSAVRLSASAAGVVADLYLLLTALAFQVDRSFLRNLREDIIVGKKFG